MAESALPPRPDHCPEGHELGPGKASTSWVMELHQHRLYCVTCGMNSRILLADGAVWEVLIGDRWVQYE